MNFWNKLKKPFFCLAPMSDVTDIAFRFVLSKYGKNRENKDQVVFLDRVCGCGWFVQQAGQEEAVPYVEVFRT